jgi:RNA polymerase sigma-70 factor (ECF subfamily)
MNPVWRAEGAGPTPDHASSGGDSFREQAEILRARIVAAVRRTCPHWLADRAEDVVQNALIKLMAVSRKSEGETRFSTVYLEKTVYGAVVDEIRRASRRKEMPMGDEGAAERIASMASGPERHAASGEIGRGISDCLQRLSRPRRLAVTLYLQGCSVPRAAVHLRWTTKKTENLVYRGLADLRACLRSKGMTP